MTYGYEQLSPTDHTQVLKVAAYGSTGRCEKEMTRNSSYARVKTRNGWDKLPLTK